MAEEFLLEHQINLSVTIRTKMSAISTLCTLKNVINELDDSEIATFNFCNAREMEVKDTILCAETK